MNTLFLLFGMALIPIVSVLGQTKGGPFDGVWQAVEVTCGGPTGPVMFKPGLNLTIFSGRHYSRIGVQTDKPHPVLENPSNATADELRQVWGPEAGTYEMAENQMTTASNGCKEPGCDGSNVTLIYSYKLEAESECQFRVRTIPVHNRKSPL